MSFDSHRIYDRRSSDYRETLDANQSRAHEIMAGDPCATGKCAHAVHCEECGFGMDYPTKSGLCDRCYHE